MVKKMSIKKIIYILMITGLISISMGCTAPESEKNPVNEHIVGGVAVGVSPRMIIAERGENVSFNVDLQSTENADDRVTISINGSWIDETLTQDIKAGGNASVPVSIVIPQDAVNMSFRVKAMSKNLNATSATSGIIFIKR
jgi:hypothetical protein